MLRRISRPGVFAIAVAAALVSAWQLSAGQGNPPPGGDKAQARKPDDTGKPAHPLTGAETLEQLAAPMDVPQALTESRPLGEALDYLNRGRGWPQLLLHQEAFKEENPDVPDLRELPVRLPALKGITRAKILRLLLDQIPTRNATYLVRPGYVEITTLAAAAPARQLVRGAFVRRPLEEALQELADQVGISVVVDARAANKARVPVTATFRGDTSLLNAVRLLADMADLQVIVADNVVYVTLRTNTAPFPPSEGLDPKQPAGAGA